MWTPTHLSSCAPGLKSKSGALTGWVTVTGHTLGAREKEVWEISIQYILLLVVLDLSQDLGTGAFSKFIKDVRFICFTWQTCSIDSDAEENKEIPATPFHPSGIIYVSESSQVIKLNILWTYHWDGLPSPMCKSRMWEMESLSNLSEGTYSQDIQARMWTCLCSKNLWSLHYTILRIFLFFFLIYTQAGIYYIDIGE